MAARNSLVVPSGKPEGLVVGSRRRFDQIADNSRDSLPAAVASLKSFMGLAAVPGDDEYEAIRILDTLEHFDVVAAAIASEDLRVRMGFLDEGCKPGALHLEPGDFANAHRLSFPFTGLGRSRGGCEATPRSPRLVLCRGSRGRLIDLVGGY